MAKGCSWQLKYEDEQARVGELSLGEKHSITTPVFMPVGTAGTVKGVWQKDLQNYLKASLLLANTYHLYLRPGEKVLREAGGLHRFMQWPGALLTDSGGYQVFSLSERCKIHEEGVRFRSHIDGSEHLFTPQKIIDLQRSMGANLMMTLDECPAYDAPPSYVQRALHRTQQWWQQSKKRFSETKACYGQEQSLWPVLQGGIHQHLRQEAVEKLLQADAEPPDGFAIGGLSIGEPAETRNQVVTWLQELLPVEKPRYLMGVGRPQDIIEAISRGIDMFDCVIPTREGRNGRLFTSEGVLNIRNAKWKHHHQPIDPQLPYAVSQEYSRAYLRHLFSNNEMLGAQMASLHNLSFYFHTVQECREHIQKQTFQKWKEDKILACTRTL